MKYLITSILSLLVGCASLVSNEVIPIDPVDAKYIEAETLLKNAYKGLATLGNAELVARSEGKSVGSVISRARYFQGLDRLDDLKEAVRQGRALVGDSSCVKMESFKTLDIKGCLGREQLALFVVTLLEKEAR